MGNDCCLKSNNGCENCVCAETRASVQELTELRTLVEQAEIVMGHLEKLVPSDQSKSWLEWRRAGLAKRLVRVKSEMVSLVNDVQVEMLNNSQTRKSILMKQAMKAALEAAVLVVTFQGWQLFAVISAADYL